MGGGQRYERSIETINPSTGINTDDENMRYGGSMSTEIITSGDAGEWVDQGV